MRGLRLSLFAKLSLVALATVVAIAWIVGEVIGTFFREGQEHGWEHKLAGYVRFVGDRVFAAPDAGEIERIAARLGVNIRYEGSDFTHTTGSMPEVDLLLEAAERRGKRRHWGGHRRHLPDDIRPVIHEGRFFVVHTRPPQRMAIGLDKSTIHAMAQLPYLVAGALVLIAAVIGCAYLLVRRMLQPLRQLERNQAAVARGEWPDEMHTQGSDEVARLVEGFNRMQRQVRSMLETKERLLADISHEFRTPLARMKVATELMDDQKARARLSEDIAELDALTEEILEGARLRSGKGTLGRERVAVADLLADALGGFGASAADFIRVEDRSGGASASVDRRRVARALRNLVDNSLKHSELGPESVRVRARIDGGCVVFEVSDRGPGLPKENLDRIFDSFYRADRSRSRATGGYGLGLRMCRAVAEAHGGSVSAASAPGDGVTVTIRIPAGA